ncbi:MAG: Ig-like domain-containing protein, partial [Spirochaetaceae bacterium]|nr:Ig-like domain-containing protein [Spirochaetaceae bacterium]
MKSMTSVNRIFKFLAGGFFIFLVITACSNPLEVGLGKKVDVEVPTISVDDWVNGDYATGELVLSGAWGDDGVVTDITITLNGESSENFEADFDPEGDEWTVSIDTATYTDGEKELIIYIKDDTGKSQDKKLLLIFDNNKPVVMVNSPLGYETTTFNKDITLRGECADNSGIREVHLSLFNDSGNELSILNADGTDTETQSNTVLLEGTNAWSYKFKSANYTDATGSFQFVITATDKSGQQNDYYYHYEDILSINSSSAVIVEDLMRFESLGSSTAISFDAAALATQQLNATAPMILNVNQSLDMPVFDFDIPSESNPTLGDNAWAYGKVRDDDGVDINSVEISLDGGSWITPDEVSVSNGVISWSQDLTSLDEGGHTLQIQAADINGEAGQSNLLEYLIDSQGPALNISSPSTGEYFNATFDITGTTSDNIGVKSIEVSIDNGAYISVSSFDPDVYTEESSVAGSIKVYNWTHSFNVDGSNDGSHMVKIRATDMGDKTFIESLQVYVDSVDPDASFLTPAENNVVNGWIQVQGTTANQSPIVQLEMVVTGSLGTSNTYIYDGTTDEFDNDADLEDLLLASLAGDPAPTGNATSFYSWIKNLDTTVYTDESPLDITMNVTDIAGNIATESVTVSIDQDTDLPEMIFDNLDPAGSASDNTFSGSPSIFGRLQDDDGVDTSSVEISFDNGSTWLDPTITGSGRSISWVYDTAGLAEGANYTVMLRARDIFQGPIETSSAIPFAVDLGAPEVTVTEIDWANGNLLSGFQGAYINDDFTISGTAVDGLEVAGVEVNINNEVDGGTGDPVYVSIPNSSGDVSNWTWSHVFTTGSIADGDVALKFRSTDGANKTAFKDIVLVLDTAAPSVEFIDLYGAAQRSAGLNGLLHLKGTANDENQLNSVQYAVILDDGSPSVADVGSWTTMASQYSWDLWLDSTAMADGDYVVFVRATDSAGNTTSDADINLAMYDFTIDQSTDNPTFQFDNLAAGATPSDNLIGLGKNVLTGKVFDDDGITIASVAITLDNGTDSITEPVVISGTDGLTEYSWSYTLPDNATLPESADAYTISLSATDKGETGGTLTKAGVTSSYPTGAGYINSYLDRSLPVLVEDTVDTTDLQISRTDVSFGGTASDGNDLASLTVSDDGGAPVVIPVTLGSWTYDFPNTTDGQSEVVFTATDTSGRTATVTRNVLIDATAPTDPVIDAFNGTYHVNELVASGSASDATSGLASVQYSLNDADWFNVTGTGSWFSTINITSLGEGDRTLYIRAVDQAGNTSNTTTRGYVIDRNNPVLVVDAAFDGTAYKDDDFTINGTIADTLPLGVSPVVVSVTDSNGDPIDLSGNPLSYNTVPDPDTWSQLIPITLDGVHTITIVATDNSGRTSTAERTVVIDSTAPYFSDINLSDADLISSTSFTVSGLASDDAGSGVQSVEYNLNSAGWTSATGTNSWNIALTGLTDDLTSVLELRTTDKSGNESAITTINFLVDTALPTSTVSGVNTSFEYVNSAVNLTGTAADNNGILSVEVSYSLDGAAYVDLTETGTLPAWAASLPAGDGIYDITIEVTDNAGRPATYTRRVGVDTAGPELTITAPADSESIDGASASSYTIRGTVTDDGGKGVTSLLYSDTGVWGGEELPITLSGFNWSKAAVDFSGAEGSRSLYVRASDGLNTPVDEQVDFFHDLAAPLLSETGINSADTQFVNNNFDFSGLWTESNSLVDIEISYQKDGGAWNVLETIAVNANGTNVAWSATTVDVDTDGAGADTGLTDGDYLFHITATDVAGRTKVIERTMVIDTVAPTMASISDLTSIWHTTASNVASGTAADADSGLARVEYRVAEDGTADTESWSLFTGTTTFSATIAIVDGNDNVLEIRAEDRAGNYSIVDSQTIWVDTQTPTLGVSSPSGSTLLNGQSDLSIVLTASDASSGPNTAQASLTSNFSSTIYSADISSGSATVTLPAADILALAETSHIIYIRTSDIAGLYSASATRDIEVDKTLPTGSFSSHETDDVVNRTIDFFGTANDNKSLVGSGNLQLWNETAGSWEDETNVVVSGIYNWTVTGLDTTLYDIADYDSDSGTAGIQLGLRLELEDSAGNIGYTLHSAAPGGFDYTSFDASYFY